MSIQTSQAQTWSRRRFLTHTGGVSAGMILGLSAPFARNLPAGFIPAVSAEEMAAIQGKAGLTLLNDRPLNAETPPHLLDDEITPVNRHFIRNNGHPPANMDAAAWRLTIDGLVDRPLSLSIADLQREFEVITQRLLLECAGNGRAFFDPPARGNQWTYGAVACSEWTGVRLADVLKAAGVKPGAVYTAHEGGRCASFRQSRQKTHFTRSAHAKGAARQQPDRLPAKRRAIAPHERGPAPARDTGLAGFLFAKMADPRLASGSGA